MNAQDIIDTLQLIPHSEGGFYRRIWQADPDDRLTATSIYVLLLQDQPTTWHRMKSASLWHFYSGAPLQLCSAPSRHGPRSDLWLGPDLARSQRPVLAVPSNHWQRSLTKGAYTLAGVTVSPGFKFEDFTLADPDFDIPQG